MCQRNRQIQGDGGKQEKQCIKIDEKRGGLAGKLGSVAYGACLSTYSIKIKINKHELKPPLL